MIIEFLILERLADKPDAVRVAKFGHMFGAASDE